MTRPTSRFAYKIARVGSGGVRNLTGTGRVGTGHADPDLREVTYPVKSLG